MFNSNTIIAGASALDKNVSNFALKNSISGFEFMSCIPGTVGGAVRMNSGCYGNDISKILISVQVMDFDGNVKAIQSSDIKFYYRGSSLNNNLIIISATFKGKKDNNLNVQQKMNSFMKEKKILNRPKLKHVVALLKILRIKRLGSLLKILAAQA